MSHIYPILFKEELQQSHRPVGVPHVVSPVAPTRLFFSSFETRFPFPFPKPFVCSQVLCNCCKQPGHTTQKCCWLQGFPTGGGRTGFAYPRGPATVIGTSGLEASDPLVDIKRVQINGIDSKKSGQLVQSLGSLNKSFTDQTNTNVNNMAVAEPRMRQVVHPNHPTSDKKNK